jgi:hypothetical protein
MRSTKRQTVTSSSGRSFLQANLRFRGLKRLKIFRPRRGGASRPARPGPVNINIFEFATCLVKVLHFFRALPRARAARRRTAPRRSAPHARHRAGRPARHTRRGTPTHTGRENSQHGGRPGQTAKQLASTLLARTHTRGRFDNTPPLPAVHMERLSGETPSVHLPGHTHTHDTHALPWCLVQAHIEEDRPPGGNRPLVAWAYVSSASGAESAATGSHDLSMPPLRASCLAQRTPPQRHRCLAPPPAPSQHPRTDRTSPTHRADTPTTQASSHAQRWK